MEHWQASRFDYRWPGRSIAAGCALGGLALGVGLYRLLVADAYAPPLAGTISAGVLLGLAVFFWGLALWMRVDRLRRTRSITLTEDTISLPWSRWSASSVTVPLEQITEVRLSKVLGLTLLQLAWPGGRVVVPSSMLSSGKHFDRLVRLLSERLDASQMGFGFSRVPESTRRFRPQFSLAWLLLFVTLVAVMLGMHACVYGGYSWDTPFDVGVALALALGVRAAWAGEWPVRVFVLWFFLGFWMELLLVYGWFALDWVRFSAASPTPENWYPLTFALWQLAARCPQAVWVLEGPRASLLGGAISGLACGCAAVVVCCVARYASSHTNRQKGPPPRRFSARL